MDYIIGGKNDILYNEENNHERHPQKNVGQNGELDD